MQNQTPDKETKKPKIVFFGTPDFAVESLKRILNEGYHVEAVVTAPDKPAGRGKKIKESEVKQFAKAQGLRILQPQNLKSPEFITTLKELAPDVGVIVAFRMLPEAVWSLPRYGTFNLHASLLPDYRGAAPIHHAIINGEKITGVTTFFIDNKIDTGAIIGQIPVRIGDEDNFGTLYEKLKNTGAGLVVDTLKNIEKGTVVTRPQDDSKALHPAPKLNKENTRIDWTQPANKIYNFIRGLSPYPGAWAKVELDGKIKRIIIYKADFQIKKHEENPGKTLISGKNLLIAVSDGYILPLELKLEGKKQMPVKSFINGLKNIKSIHFK